MLLFANFPLAGAIVVAATIVDSCYTVVVVNESTERIENARVVGAGYDELVGTVSPGGRRSVWIWPALQGRLELRARIGASERVELVDGYTLGGGKAVVTLRPDGELDVRLFDH